MQIISSKCVRAMNSVRACVCVWPMIFMMTLRKTEKTYKAAKVIIEQQIKNMMEIINRRQSVFQGAFVPLIMMKSNTLCFLQNC